MNNKGFTLAETLVSILLLSIIMVGGLALYFHSNNIMRLAIHKKMATQEANARMEELRNTAYLDLDEQHQDNPVAFTIGSLDGTSQVTVSPLGITAFKEITVAIKWTEVSQDSESDVTLIARSSP